MPSQIQSNRECPRGTHRGRVDEQGRLKLPGAMVQFLSDRGDTRVFVTTFDERVARLYPVSVWNETIGTLASQEGEESEAAEDLAFLANWYGADSKVDRGGVVVLGEMLRRRLELDGQSVYLYCYRGHIRILPERVREERLQRAQQNAGEKLRMLERAGLR